MVTVKPAAFTYHFSAAATQIDCDHRSLKRVPIKSQLEREELYTSRGNIIQSTQKPH